METKEVLREFLKSQKLISVATIDESGNPWSTNLYFITDKELNLYFFTPQSTLHGEHIANNHNVSFTVAWYQDGDISNRKGVQGTGHSEVITNPVRVAALSARFTGFTKAFMKNATYEYFRKKMASARPYIIKPTYLKFWSDEAFPGEGFREITFE